MKKQGQDPLKLKVPPRIPHDEPSPGFTGVARSMQAFENQGWRNFRIVTLFIQNDQVVRIEYSDPYCNWEAIARLEIDNQISALNLNSDWEDGKTFKK